MSSISYLQFLHAALPEVCLVLTAFLVLAIDVSLRTKPLLLRFSVAATLASFGCILAIVRLAFASGVLDSGQGMFVTSPLVCAVQQVVAGLAIVTLLLSISCTFTEHVGEYVLLILLATVGMMFLIGSADILVTFVSLELLSLAFYALTAFNKSERASAEAALKYFLFGGISAAILLFGFTLLYGVSASTGYAEIAYAIVKNSSSPMVMLAIITTVVGFGFKVAAVPFHFWAPDVYEGAPNPVAGLIASSSKVASFFVFFGLMTTCFRSVAGDAGWMSFRTGWVPVLAVIAALSMIVGNFGAVMQSGARRLLAYSAIAHTGYMLIALVTHTTQSLTALLYYVITYSLSTLGAFGVVATVEQNTGNDALVNFNGLSRRAPVLSGCLFVFLLSQAGIPPLAGFFGKFFLFMEALRSAEGNSALLWLVILAVAASAVSLYYYLQVLKRVYVLAPAELDAHFHVSWTAKAVIATLALCVIAAGVFPEPLRAWIHTAMMTSRY